ncbi:CTD kinase subunit beta [Erysiphe neolycopersici]|uniref:RNA polymerase II holoenzyme cyclin-like subunit n=1 Tax=Erysiphe neolycopersici TaxID=212602 RepID=A0A420I244_9PEZI|nr:CTD kinase subunit beta [Erysiphe neolycopersici]
MASTPHQSNGNKSASNNDNNTSGSASNTRSQPKSRINVSNQYIFEPQLQNQLRSNGTISSREDNFRLLGIQWISDVGKALQLPVRTFCTAATYYHKFRLIHKDNEYHYHDAAAGALLTACKIEDTLKKSKEILCAAHNLKVLPSEQLSSDDSIFEGHSKIVIGLERLMLEASGFDFRVRYPQKHLVKVTKELGLDKSVYLTAYNIMIDLYRTLAPLKQTSATMSFACLELAVLIMDEKKTVIPRTLATSLCENCSTTRTEILETILDLLDLYTHSQKSSIIGPLHHIDKFIQIQIILNQEIEQDPSLNRNSAVFESLGVNGAKKTPQTPVTPGSPEIRRNGNTNTSPTLLSPRPASSGRRSGMNTTRVPEITIRFMLDAEQARKEQEMVSEYFKTEYEEYEVEVEEPIRPPPRPERPNRNHTRGRDDRHYHYNTSKRARR